MSRQSTSSQLSPKVVMSSWQLRRGQLAYALALGWLALNRVCCTCYMYLRAYWWQVSLAPGCRFYGLTRLRRHPTATMQIGAAAVFRSTAASNTFGLRQACFMSAARDAQLIIGQHCGFSGTVISAAQQIILGDRVLCGANVTISDSDRHPLAAGPRAAGAMGATAAVVIGDDVWLGANVLVLKGVTIGQGAVIAANSVVIADIPAGCLAAGVPATVRRKLAACPNSGQTSPL